MPLTRAELLHKHIIEEISRQDLVEAYNTNMDRIRGQLSKAWADPQVLDTTLEAALTNFHGQAGFRLAQDNIINKSRTQFTAHRDQLKQLGGTYYAVFASDKHLPFIRRDAFNLEMQILDDIGKRVAYYSGLNDLFDFGEYGRWGVEPNEEVALFSSNIDYLMKLAEIIYMAVSRRVPNGLILGVLGNHDIRIFQFLRHELDGYSEKRILEHMKELESFGVLQFANASKTEPILRLSDGLKWVHGISHAQNNSTVAKNTIEKCRGTDVDGDNGVLYNTVSGHIHRSFVYEHLGVVHANAGCGCSLYPSYMKHVPIRWNLGIVISEFDASGREVIQTPVDFKQQGNKLVASFKGTRYEVEATPEQSPNI